MSNAIKRNGYLSADDFFSAITVEPVDFVLPGGGVVQLRALTSIEVQKLQRTYKDDEMGMFLGALVEGMLQPKLTAEDTKRLSDAAYGKLLPVARRILALSGMGDAEEAGN